MMFDMLYYTFMHLEFIEVMMRHLEALKEKLLVLSDANIILFQI